MTRRREVPNKRKVPVTQREAQVPGMAERQRDMGPEERGNPEERATLRTAAKL